MDVRILQCFIIFVFFFFYDMNTLSVEIKENTSGIRGKNQTEIKCSYISEQGSDIQAVTFLAFNKTLIKFEPILYLSETTSFLTGPGQYLKRRISYVNISQSSTKAVIAVTNLMCVDDTLYKCQVRAFRSGFGDEIETSKNTSISVQVPPSKPDSILLTHIPADFQLISTKDIAYSTSSSSTAVTSTETETVSASHSAIQNDINAYSTFQKTDIKTDSVSLSDGGISPNLSNKTTAYSTQETISAQKTAEGDIIAVVCTGDVGKPAAEHVFKKYCNGQIVPMKETVTSTSISDMPENCSYYRTSNLTFEVTAEDNNAVIRCVVNSSMSDPDMYVETAAIEVYYPVRMPTIINYPHKTDYVVGEDTSIHLACKSDGNPKPSYVWYKENPKEQVSSNENFTITNINTTNSGNYTCEVHNIFLCNTYSKAAIVNIKIINAEDKLTPSTSGSWLNTAKGGTVIAIAIVGFLIVIGVVGVLLYRKTRKKEDYKPVDSMGSNMDQMESQIPTRGVPPTSSTKKTTGYEDVDLDDTDMKFKLVSKEETIAQVKQHNEEYLKKQKEDEDREKDNSTTPPQAAVYACVNKPKNTTTTENKPPTDQQEEDVYEESKEGLYDTSGDRRHKENITAEHFDSIENLKSADHDHIDLFSEQKSQNGAYINKAFENDCEIKAEKRQVATVSPTVRSSFEYKSDGQDNKSNQKQSTKSNQHVKPEDLTVSTEKQSTHETSL